MLPQLSRNTSGAPKKSKNGNVSACMLQAEEKRTKTGQKLEALKCNATLALLIKH